MDRDKLVALAARAEAATGADRELDAEIAYAICWRWEGWEEGDLRIEERALDQRVSAVLNRHNSIWQNLPRYTASIDAAMTLIPADWAISSLSAWPASPEDADNARPDAASVNLVQSSLKRMGRQRIWDHGSDDRKASGNAADAPRAITAAALRALASTPREGDGL